MSQIDNESKDLKAVEELTLDKQQSIEPTAMQTPIKKFWTGDKITSLSAISISLFTLVVFIYQTNIMREQQHLSVYPHLMMGNGGTGTLEYKYVLRNDGVGPAIITAIDIRGKENEPYESLSDYVRSKLSQEDSIWLYNTDIYVGKLIPAGGKVELFGLWDEAKTASLNLPPNTVEGANKLRGILNDDELKIKINYQSIYGDSWYIGNSALAPQKE